MSRAALLPGARHIVLIDGECVFCNRLVSLILRRDRRGTFSFAHIQGGFARAALLRHGRDPYDVDPVYLLANAGSPAETLLVDGAAGREIWPRLWRIAVVVRWVPLALLNVFYVAFAKVRYRLVGRYDSCHVPSAEERLRFIE